MGEKEVGIQQVGTTTQQNVILIS